MAKLVVLSAGLAGQTHELATVLTTVGRLEDNVFQIPEQSVSSHHCEILLRGSEIVIKDLNSTNGTYVNGKQVADEMVIQPGQTIRLGQVELRLENGQHQAQATPAGQQTAPAATPTAPATPPPKKAIDPRPAQTGVSLSDLEGTRPVAFEKNSPFSKKSNKGTRMFIIGAIIAGVIIFGIIFYFIFFQADIGPTP